jgi:hypothetical protein
MTMMHLSQDTWSAETEENKVQEGEFFKQYFMTSP